MRNGAVLIPIMAMAAAMPAMAADEAQDRTYDLDIPAQAMAGALHAFGRQTHQQVVFDETRLGNRMSVAVKGRFAAEPGLDRLLAGSGLTWKKGPSGVFIVMVPDSQAPAPQVAATDPAQPAAPPPPEEKPTTVVVQGKAPLNKIDRQVYDVSSDPANATGTAAEALNKIPGVAVDSQGNVTLHGRNPTLYVDGHPSLMLSGDNRGLALQSMPSSIIRSIEIISNPGAQYGSDGAGGIINIVTKSNLPAGQFGGVSGRADAAGGLTANFFETYSAGKLSLQVNGNFSNIFSHTRSSLELQQFDATGAPLQGTDSLGRTHIHILAPFLTGTLNYKLTPNDTLSLSGTAQHAKILIGNTGALSTFAASGFPDFSTSSDTSETGTNDSKALNGDFTHYGRLPDQTFRLHGSLSREIRAYQTQTQVHFTDPGVAASNPDQINTMETRFDSRKLDLSADYKTPVADDQLNTGAELTQDESRNRNLYLGPDTGAATASTLNTHLTSDFAYRQTMSAAYVTYQKELSTRWTVLAGLRDEYLTLDTDEAFSSARSRIAYNKLIPSAYATYVLSPKSKLRFSYAHRLQRPSPHDLNPSQIYVNTNTVTVGNPHLKPQETESFETGYEYTDQSLSASLRGFYRTDHRYIALSSRYVPDPQGDGNQVLQTTSLNAGWAVSRGLNLSYSNKFGKVLTVNLDGTWADNVVHNPTLPRPQSAEALSGTASLTYKPTKADQFTLRLKAVGTQLTGQGYIKPTSRGDLSYSHDLTPRLTLVMEVDDAFRGGKTVRVTDTPFVHSVTSYDLNAPTFFVSLTQRWGGFAKKH